MRNLSLFLVVVVLGIAMFASAEDGLIDIDDMSTTQLGSIVGEASTSAGDDEDGSGMLSDEGSSESGSGESTTESQTTRESTTTELPIDAVVVMSKTAKTTERPTGYRKTTTTKSPDESTGTVASEIISTQEQDKSTKELTADPNDDDMNAMARSDPEKKVLRVLTTEVIAAVVVGAVCAVILIAFLVYRLRKRDEGSYPLSDSSYKDTYKLRGDTGKEAFV